MEEHILDVFESRVLRGIFGLKRDKMVGCRRLRNQKLCKLCSLPNIIRMTKLMRMR
jgi:hypothetical protein